MKLSTIQQTLLLDVFQVKASPNEAFTLIHSNSKIRQVAGFLHRNGLLTITSGAVAPTRKATEWLIQHQLITPSHELTQIGKQFVGTAIQENSRLLRVLKISAF